MISQCDIIKDFKLRDYQNWINNSFLGDQFNVVSVSVRKDQNKQLKNVELVLVNKKSKKETSIFLTDFSCSDGLLEADWTDFVQEKVGETKWCHNLFAYYSETHKPRKFEDLYENSDDLGL